MVRVRTRLEVWGAHLEIQDTTVGRGSLRKKVLFLGTSRDLCSSVFQSLSIRYFTLYSPVFQLL